MFAGSLGFSAVADRMMRPPSLSRDQKWPRLPNRHKNDTLNRCNENSKK